MSFNKSQHLASVLDSYRMSHVKTTMDKYIEKKETIKNALQEKYKEKLCSRGIDSGSYAKHTAINIKYDIDICQAFLNNSFDTLEQMADDLYNFFRNEYEDSDLIKHSVRKQRVSVGLTFLIDGEEIQMDVVPGRELLKDDYKESKRLNLFVRPKGDDAATSTQTNIYKHVEHIKGKEQERNVIRLLKVWKVRRNKNIKSFLMELISIRSFTDTKKVPTDIWEQLKMVLTFIEANIETIKLADPANSNNIVTDTMDIEEKKQFAVDVKNMLQRIEERPEDIKYYFPVNDKFKVIAGPSILTAKTFG